MAANQTVLQAEQRSVIKFLVGKKCKPCEIYKRICDVYREMCFSKTNKQKKKTKKKKHTHNCLQMG